MAWRVEVSDTAKKQLIKLGTNEAKRIVRFLRERIESTENPRSHGKSLKGPLGELWSYRVGDYRLICDIEDGVCRVLILQIGHRSDVYR